MALLRRISRTASRTCRSDGWLLRKMFLQIRIWRFAPRRGCQRKGYAQDNVAAAIRRIEDAGAIGEVTFRIAETADLHSRPVQRLD